MVRANLKKFEGLSIKLIFQIGTFRLQTDWCQTGQF